MTRPVLVVLDPAPAPDVRIEYASPRVLGLRKEAGYFEVVTRFGSCAHHHRSRRAAEACAERLARSDR
jgi:hypothetical protein